MNLLLASCLLLVWPATRADARRKLVREVVADGDGEKDNNDDDGDEDDDAKVNDSRDLQLETEEIAELTAVVPVAHALTALNVFLITQNMADSGYCSIPGCPAYPAAKKDHCNIVEEMLKKAPTSIELVAITFQETWLPNEDMETEIGPIVDQFFKQHIDGHFFSKTTGACTEDANLRGFCKNDQPQFFFEGHFTGSKGGFSLGAHGSTVMLVFGSMTFNHRQPQSRVQAERLVWGNAEKGAAAVIIDLPCEHKPTKLVFAGMHLPSLDKKNASSRQTVFNQLFEVFVVNLKPDVLFLMGDVNMHTAHPYAEKGKDGPTNVETLISNLEGLPGRFEPWDDKLRRLQREDEFVKLGYPAWFAKQYKHRASGTTLSELRHHSDGRTALPQPTFNVARQKEDIVLDRAKSSKSLPLIALGPDDLKENKIDYYTKRPPSFTDRIFFVTNGEEYSVNGTVYDVFPKQKNLAGLIVPNERGPYTAPSTYGIGGTLDHLGVYGAAIISLQASIVQQIGESTWNKKKKNMSNWEAFFLA